ncbi:sucrose-6-phosphate hydrolase [Escherichia coli]|nr:sucrose-6-phosphate hydrolase [Escherichia coli]
MTQSRLHAAQNALAKLHEHRGNTFYPHFHLAPPAGWMNDPNGLIWFNDRYHAFYQHHPMSEHWGPMHWGHATSDDMIHWQHEPIALAPGDDNDKDGCFSGSAVDDNGVLSLIYTGHVWLDGAGNDDAIREVQCLATSRDGIHFEKQGVILTPPEGIMHFRDPKVWREADTWWMVVGAKDLGNTGQILLYRGSSLREWAFDRVLAHADAGESYMWECPDFFSLGDQHYLMFSPQGMNAEGYSYRNRFQSGVIPGMWSPGRLFAQSGHFTELDNGHDFYAPQSFLAKDGRRIVIGWMDMWESPMPSKREGWAGCMTLARELSESNGKLLQRPVHEAESLRQQHQSVSPRRISNKYVLQENAQAVEIQLQWALKNSDAEHYGLQLGTGMRLYIDNQSERLILWRYYPHENLDGYRSIPLPQRDTLALRIFIDTSSVEVFINDGEAVMSSRIYPQPEERELSLYASHGVAVLQHGALWLLG